MADVGGLLRTSLVVTEKLDGSNLCCTRDAVFARSHSGAPGHPSFDAAKAMHARIRHRIPVGLSVFGEWTYAVHSIEYEALPGWFHVFAVRWDARDFWWAWSEVEEVAVEIGATTVPVLVRDVRAESERGLQEVALDPMRQPSLYGGLREGVVVRTSAGIDGDDFARKIGKMVRADHVQTDEHWSHGPVKRQRLREAVP